MSDRRILQGTEWLNDNIIYAAQLLLKKEFTEHGGFQSSQCGRNLNFKVLGLDVKYVQILQVNSNHWVMVSNIDTSSNKASRNRVLIFDSLMPKRISTDLKQQVCSFVRPMKSKFMFDVMNVMTQVNLYDCGLHAIANATEILHGRNPCKCVWDTRRLREHLIKCLENRIMSRFPIVRERRIAFGGAVKFFKEEFIYCSCRMPDDEHSGMICCSSCSEWYHLSCVKITDVKQYKGKKWLCVKCVPWKD